MFLQFRILINRLQGELHGTERAYIATQGL